jgi:hypothetical protein
MRTPNRFHERGPTSTSDFVLDRFGNEAASVSFELIDFLEEIRRKRNCHPLANRHRQSMT